MPSHRSLEEKRNYEKAYQYMRFCCENPSSAFLTISFIQKLHKILYPGDRGTFKIKNNQISVIKKEYQSHEIFQGIPAVLTKKYMAQLYRLFRKRWKEYAIDPIVLISAYTLDFFRIHPFADGNGRIARLMIQYLLHQGGYEIAQWMNLEERISQSRDQYLLSIGLSLLGWREEKHNLNPWCEYLTELLLFAYNAIFAEYSGQKTDLQQQVLLQNLDLADGKKKNRREKAPTFAKLYPNA